MNVITVCVTCTLCSGSLMGATLDVWQSTHTTAHTFVTAIEGNETIALHSSGLTLSTTSGKDFLVLSSFDATNPLTAVDANFQGRWQVASDYSSEHYTYSQSNTNVQGSAIYEPWLEDRQNTGLSGYKSTWRRNSCGRLTAHRQGGRSLWHCERKLATRGLRFHWCHRRVSWNRGHSGSEKVTKNKGAAMSYAITSDLEPGVYTVKMEQNVVSCATGQGVSTYNASINAFALNFTGDAGKAFALTDAIWVGFSTQSVPEPSRLSTLAVSSIASMAHRRCPPIAAAKRYSGNTTLINLCKSTPDHLTQKTNR